MIKRLPLLLALFITIIYPQVSHGDKERYIEIFDPKENRVIEKIEVTDEIDDMVVNWIREIDEVHLSINPIKDDGYAIKLPLNSAIQVENKWMKASVEEVYLVVPKEDPAFFVIFENRNKPIFFIFPGEVDELSHVLDFKLK